MKFAITGEFGRGKDTLANLLEAELQGTRPVSRLAFADALKQELAEMVFNYVQPEEEMTFQDVPDYGKLRFAEPGAYQRFDQAMRARKDLNGLGYQWWGEYRRQTVSEDYWVDHPVLAGQYARACDHEHHIIITDMRHHNENRWCHARGFHCIRIEGPCHTSGDVRDPNHPSEVHVKNLPVHTVFHNTLSIEQLAITVHDTMPLFYEWFNLPR